MGLFKKMNLVPYYMILTLLYIFELEISGNEESGIEDNADEEVGEGVDPLVNGPDEDD